jgi:hypothetical protein
VEERGGVTEFWLRERKLSLGKILTIKTVDFYVKRFHIMRRVNIGCFFYPEIPKNRYGLEKTLGFKLISGFWLFLLCF